MPNIEEAHRLVKEQLDKGIPESRIRDAMWKAGFTQEEIGSAFSEAPKTPAPTSAERPAAPQTGSKASVIAVAVVVVLTFTIIPFIMPRPGSSGEVMSKGDVLAYPTLLKEKIKREGGVKYDITMTMRSGRTSVTMSGVAYEAPGGEGRLDVKMSSSSLYGSGVSDVTIISDNTGTYTRSEGDYLNPEPYWTKGESGMTDMEDSLLDTDYYDQGSVECGTDTCTKIFANYEGVKLTIQCREDGFCPYLNLESPTDSLTLEQRNPVFGPVDESLFKIPEGEEVRDEYDFGF